MVESKWTPGPWRMIQPIALDYRAPLVYGPNAETLIATAEGGGPRRAIDAAETRANAFLIAAAPSLYDALCFIVSEIEVDGGVDTSEWLALDKAHAALALARGETNG